MPGAQTTSMPPPRRSGCPCHYRRNFRRVFVIGMCREQGVLVVLSLKQQRSTTYEDGCAGGPAMTPQLGVAAVAGLVGLCFTASGRKLCSHGCWVDDLVRLLLPTSCEWLAGGLPWFAIGVLLGAQALRSRIRLPASK